MTFFRVVAAFFFARPVSLWRGSSVVVGPAIPSGVLG